MGSNTGQNDRGDSSVPPVVLAASGLDPTGSAGLLADVRVLQSLGCHPCGVVTLETVQTSRGLTEFRPTDPELFHEQLSAIMDDVNVAAVKIGALGSRKVIEILCRELKRVPKVPVVLDPVFAPSLGTAFLDRDGMKAMSRDLLEHVFLATPNLSELGAPAGLVVREEDDEMMIQCASGWIEAGVKNVLVTGLRGEGVMVDRLISMPGGQVDARDFSHREQKVGEVHGTGCVLSSAIAAYLALGEDLPTAIEKAGEYVSKAVERAQRFGDGALFWVV